MTLTAGGVTQMRVVSGGGDSQDGLLASFGLGEAISVDSLTVTWPGGKVDTYTVPVIDRRVTLNESP